MKTTFIRLFSFMLVAVPMLATAQSNIKAAFDAIIKCPEARITDSHTLDKDPATGIKIGQSDVYRFVLPAAKSGLIKNVVSAIEKDSEEAYGINRGKSDDGDNGISVAIGNGERPGVKVAEPGCEYIYCLFLAPTSEDPDGIYRYAYGMNYKEEDGKLVGKLVTTYATTLKYRQQTSRQQQYDVLRNLSNGAYVIPGTPQSWFDQLIGCLKNIGTAKPKIRISLATKAFKIIQNTSSYPEVSESDKDAIREVLKGMISDKKYSETVLYNLLNRCLIEIK